MFAGEKINATEWRAGLHMALRNFSGNPVLVDGHDVMTDVIGKREKMPSFAGDVREGRVRGARGQPLTDVVNIGIGGCDLGPAMAARALAPFAPPKLRSPLRLQRRRRRPRRPAARARAVATLFIVASKTFTTQETMANARTARAWFAQRSASRGRRAFRRRLDATRRRPRSASAPHVRLLGLGRRPLFALVGDRAAARDRDRRRPISRVSAPARDAMDQHFASPPVERNMPMLLGLLDVWYRNFHRLYEPRRDPLRPAAGSALPAYLQQLEMEATASASTLAGAPFATSPVVWGEPGTNGQHAFFQMLHQGTDIVPVEFIVAATPTEADPHHHDLLLANCLAQRQALMRGRTTPKRRRGPKQGASEAVAIRLAPHKSFPGNRPTSTFLYRISTRARSAPDRALRAQGVHGAIWDINSFDQWGVELGKELASSLPDRRRCWRRHEPLDSSTAGLMAQLRALRAKA